MCFIFRMLITIQKSFQVHQRKIRKSTLTVWSKATHGNCHTIHTVFKFICWSHKSLSAKYILPTSFTGFRTPRLLTLNWISWMWVEQKKEGFIQYFVFKLLFILYELELRFSVCWALSVKNYERTLFCFLFFFVNKKFSISCWVYCILCGVQSHCEWNREIFSNKTFMFGFVYNYDLW